MELLQRGFECHCTYSLVKAHKGQFPYMADP